MLISKIVNKYLKDNKIVLPENSHINNYFDDLIENEKDIIKDEFSHLPKIIGITGRKYHGKDTLGKHLISLGYIQMEFAKPLKQALQSMFEFDDDQLYGDNKETIDPFWKASPRAFMQFFGTDLMRNKLSELIPWIGKDVWVQIIKRKIMKIWETNPNQKIVFTDIRFPNELDLIKQLGGKTIRVKRDIEKSIGDFVAIHESEIHIDEFIVDFDFDNNSTIPDLYAQFDKIVWT